MTFNTFDYTSAQGVPEVMLRMELLHSRLLEANPSNKAALEVGIGSADVTLMLASLFRTVVAIDSSNAVCQSATTRLSEKGFRNVQLVESKVEEANLADQLFEHVILLGVLEHLADPVSVLRKLKILLPPSGRIHVLVNLANSIHRWLGVAMGMINSVEELSESDHTLGHERVYSAQLLHEHIASAGMRVMFEERFYLKPLPTSYMNQLPEKLNRAFSELGKQFPEFASYIYLEVVT